MLQPEKLNVVEDSGSYVHTNLVLNVVLHEIRLKQLQINLTPDWILVLPLDPALRVPTQHSVLNLCVSLPLNYKISCCEKIYQCSIRLSKAARGEAEGHSSHLYYS